MPTAEWSVLLQAEIDDEEGFRIDVEALCQRRGKSESFRYRLYLDDQLVSEERRTECEPSVTLRARVNVPESEPLRAVATLSLESLGFQSIEEIEESVKERFQILYAELEHAAGFELRKALFDEHCMNTYLVKEKHPSEIIALANAYGLCWPLARIAKKLYDGYGTQASEGRAVSGRVADVSGVRHGVLARLRSRWEELTSDVHKMVAAAESERFRVIHCQVVVHAPRFHWFTDDEMQDSGADAWQPF